MSTVLYVTLVAGAVLGPVPFIWQLIQLIQPDDLREEDR